MGNPDVNLFIAGVVTDQLSPSPQELSVPDWCCAPCPLLLVCSWGFAGPVELLILGNELFTMAIIDS